MSDKNNRYITVYEKRLSIAKGSYYFIAFVIGILFLVIAVIGLATGNALALSWGWTIELWINYFFMLLGAFALILSIMQLADEGKKDLAKKLIAYVLVFIVDLVLIFYGILETIAGHDALGFFFASALIGVTDSIIIIYLELVKDKGAFGIDI